MRKAGSGSGLVRIISALPNSVRVADPTGKAFSDRSSGHPALMIAAASGPAISSAMFRWEISVKPWTFPESAVAISCAMASVSLSGATRSHSFGPSRAD